MWVAELLIVGNDFPGLDIDDGLERHGEIKTKVNTAGALGAAQWAKIGLNLHAVTCCDRRRTLVNTA